MHYWVLASYALLILFEEYCIIYKPGSICGRKKAQVKYQNTIATISQRQVHTMNKTFYKLQKMKYMMHIPSKISMCNEALS